MWITKEIYNELSKKKKKRLIEFTNINVVSLMYFVLNANCRYLKMIIVVVGALHALQWLISRLVYEGKFKK